ncbi:hypothetical protein [Pseudofrankia sp. BMG5.37]|uniref:hypothetical protein n=1 Tax=Pseudofrankia sp. BMG5.37 TaxID=3050035 RepID=UPI002895609D|nr:hypothetical protein [Pseudofrankia sp. BMG5.37]MDT3438327.1 hypothetical protein [Pseudofrankia sp. BMG5.37]
MTMHKVGYYTEQAQAAEQRAANETSPTISAALRREAEEWRDLASDALTHASPDPETDTRS